MFLFRVLLVFLVTIVYAATAWSQSPDTLWLHKINFGRFTQDWQLTPKAYTALQSDPLRIRKKTYTNGLAAPREAHLRVELGGKAKMLKALVGVDDRASKNCSMVLTVHADGKPVFKSAPLKRGAKGIDIQLDLTNVQVLVIEIDDNGTGVYTDKLNFVNAFITYAHQTPTVYNFNYINKRHILTPPAALTPRINGPKVYGVRPGHPFIYRIPCTGKKPIRFAAENLPAGLTLDPQTGIITGKINTPGETPVKFVATNELGTTSRDFKIVVGNQIALTPPMGWNEYNRYGSEINQEIMIKSVDALVGSGLVDYGWSYVNIDDSWSVLPGSDDAIHAVPPRDANGRINTNKKFPDMRALTDYIHSHGLKAGIYSSPAKLTCAGYTATYGFEAEDAKRWADWGFDYLKYDYCSYNQLFKEQTLETLQKPYIEMRRELDKQDRDIVFSFSQYGVGESWKWAKEIGGNLWRTTGDLIDTWSSLSEIGFAQAGLEPYAGPGHWNDPDMLVIGYVGWGEYQYPSRLTADEQYTHMSLWALLAAPLLMGCDIIEMDEFTRSLVTNAELIDINQDALGKQASRIYAKDSLEIWVKPLEDGSKAVGLFNRNAVAKTVRVDWSALGIDGGNIVRDVWRQTDEGLFRRAFSAKVPAHGVKLITIRRP